MTLRDQLLNVSAALPNGAASTNTGAIDTMTGLRDTNCVDVEFSFDAPACTVGELADTQTIAYIIQASDDAAFTSPSTLVTLGTQTGAGGAGAAGFNQRFKLPRKTGRYIRARATKTGASNASTKSMTLVPLF